MKQRPNTAFIDADHMVYKFGFSPESPNIVCSRLEEHLMEVVYIELQCDTYDAFITGRDNFRYELATTHLYKGNREGIVRPPHYEVLRDKLVSLGATVSVGQEADDDVAIASTVGTGWIVHVDKDLDQLPGWHYNPKKKEKYYVTEEEGLKNFYIQILMGDRVDNIVGLYKVGPVTAAKLLNGLSEDRELYEAVRAAYESKEEPVERILENGQLLWLSRYEGQRWEIPKEF
jgi:hypothetical protein